MARALVPGYDGSECADAALAAAIVGSVPHKLLQISERPVLVVPVRDA